MNVLLCCTAGMSTSMLVSKMRKEADEESKIWAVPVSDVRSHVGEANVMLLGPQVSYMLPDMKKIGEEHDIPVDSINQMHYGLCNGKEVLKQAKTLVENHKG